MTEFQIIATIGPSSRNSSVIEELIKLGMTMARLSFAHGSHPAHTQTISLVRKVCKRKDISVPILQDLQGPKLRIGNFNTVKLSPGDTVILVPQEQFDSIKDCPRSNSKKDDYIPLIGDIHQHVKVKDLVFINNMKVQLEVKEVDGVSTVCEVKYGGVVRPEKGVNLPMTDLPTKALTSKDKEDLVFGLKHKVEWIALSFVKSADDIIEAREWLRKRKQKQKDLPLVMSKIETKEAICNLSQIVEVSDSVMVARGDLALEVSFTKLPFLQKRIISVCRSLEKPVVVATGFMDSMCHQPVPSRSEIMDVANAFLDGADGLLLSQETAVGRYPIKTLEMVSSILLEVRKSFPKLLVCPPGGR